MGHADRARRLFDAVAEQQEFQIDLRPFLDALPVDFAGRSVLEAGCGQGLAACHLAGARGARHVTGFDMSPASIERAERLKGQRGLGNVRFAVSSIEEFRAPERFDVVCSFGVLQYVPDFFGCVDALCGHLKGAPGSALVFTMSQPTAISRLGAVARAVLSRLPEAAVPAAVKAIACLLAPLGIHRRYGDRPLENLVREALFPPIFNLVRPRRAAEHLEAAGFSVAVEPFLGIDGMYTVIARRLG